VLVERDLTVAISLSSGRKKPVTANRTFRDIVVLVALQDPNTCQGASDRIRSAGALLTRGAPDTAPRCLTDSIHRFAST
jgi:hypothetical protein